MLEFKMMVRVIKENIVKSTLKYNGVNKIITISELKGRVHQLMYSFRDN